MVDGVFGRNWFLVEKNVPKAELVEVAGGDGKVARKRGEVGGHVLVLEQCARNAFAGVNTFEEAVDLFGGGLEVADGGVEAGFVGGQDVVRASGNGLQLP